MNFHPDVHKRGLHDPTDRARYWLAQSVAHRLEAVETIRQAAPTAHDAQPAFPRVFKLTRKARR